MHLTKAMTAALIVAHKKGGRFYAACGKRTHFGDTHTAVAAALVRRGLAYKVLVYGVDDYRLTGHGEELAELLGTA